VVRLPNDKRTFFVLKPFFALHIPNHIAKTNLGANLFPTLQKKGVFTMITNKRTTAGRISVWVLVFALIFTTLSASFALTAHAKGGVMSDVGDAAREITSDVGDAARDTADKISDTANGTVNDSDGMIGNESDETENTDHGGAMDEGTSMGWIGLVIAIVIVLIAIVLIIILVPRKKKR